MISRKLVYNDNLSHKNANENSDINYNFCDINKNSYINNSHYSNFNDKFKLNINTTSFSYNPSDSSNNNGNSL